MSRMDGGGPPPPKPKVVRRASPLPRTEVQATSGYKPAPSLTHHEIPVVAHHLSRVLTQVRSDVQSSGPDYGKHKAAPFEPKPPQRPMNLSEKLQPNLISLLPRHGKAAHAEGYRYRPGVPTVDFESKSVQSLMMPKAGGEEGAAALASRVDAPAARFEAKRVWDEARKLFPGALPKQPPLSFASTIDIPTRSFRSGATGETGFGPQGKRPVKLSAETEAGLATPNNPTGYAQSAATLLHEWAHAYQAPRFYAKAHTRTEGGAEAFAHRHIAALLKRLGVTTTPDPFSGGTADTYTPQKYPLMTEAVDRSLGPRWVDRTQFTSPARRRVKRRS